MTESTVTLRECLLHVFYHILKSNRYEIMTIKKRIEKRTVVHDAFCVLV